MADERAVFQSRGAVSRNSVYPDENHQIVNCLKYLLCYVSRNSVYPDENHCARAKPE
jgi:hypothetical protein